MHTLALLLALATARPRLRDLGVTIGTLPTGSLNAITDVEGVRVGQATLIRGDNIRTGVTAILPHGGNLFQEKVAGAVFVGNGFGKIMGTTQVEELGEIETPILLTSTLNVPRVADAVIDYMLALPGNEDVRSINPLVGETNDGTLNDIRSRPVGREEVFAAIRGAKGGPVDEGSVGAGAGTIGSGDYAIAFSTARGRTDLLSNDAMSPLFLATIEATEEAIDNSLTKATTVTGNGKTIDALPIGRVREILKKYGR